MSKAPKTRKMKLSGPLAWAAGEEATRLAKALGTGNIRFVGGAVRDALLGKEVQDVDIATILPPEEAMERLEKEDIRVIPTGLKHGTVSAILKKRAFEITTLRHDVETFGRHADVAFHKDWGEDAARRDFTMNALYLSPDGTLYDYFEGEKDLKGGKVRFIGKPEDRIREDALRIMRFFRFHARFGKGNPDKKGLAACRKNLDMLDVLSAERVRDELLKTLKAPDPVPVLEEMEKSGIFRHILQGASIDLPALETLITLENKLGETDVVRRFGALLGESAFTTGRFGKSLRLSKKDQARLHSMKEARADLSAAAKDIRKQVYLLGHKGFEDRLLLSAGKKDVAKVRKQLEEARKFSIPDFPVSGKDLKKKGIEPGPNMGRVLDELEKKWVESDFKAGREELLKTLGQ